MTAPRDWPLLRVAFDIAVFVRAPHTLPLFPSVYVFGRHPLRHHKFYLPWSHTTVIFVILFDSVWPLSYVGVPT